MTYSFLQHYWWFLISLLGALLVFLLFVQGINSMISLLGKDDAARRVVLNSTGRKWEITFTTLVTFGGAFFASFPLFYSTSFGGAYWLWMAILFTFVLQAVSYEFQNKLGNFLGPATFRACLVVNGVLGPVLLGAAVATFFNGSNFEVMKDVMLDAGHPAVISRWANASNGLDALLDIWNVVFGLAVLYLARVLGSLYEINNVGDEPIRANARRQLPVDAVLFLVLFLVFFIRLLLKDGYAVDPATGIVFLEPMKYLHNLADMWYLPVLIVVGVVLLLAGIIGTLRSPAWRHGIWPAGIGVVLVVLALLLCAGWGDTAYYPSNADLQSSLTLSNSCSSEFTLRTMAYVSLLVPFVVAYIWYVWRTMDRKKITKEEIAQDEAY